MVVADVLSPIPDILIKLEIRAEFAIIWFKMWYYNQSWVSMVVADVLSPVPDILIKLEIRAEFAIIWFKMCSIDHN